MCLIFWHDLLFRAVDLYKETYSGVTQSESINFFLSDNGEFDPGSGRTLAAWIRHASQTGLHPSGCKSVANGRVSRG